MEEVNEVTYCPKCGAENKKGAVYCSNCGNRIAEGPKKKRWPLVLGIAVAVIVIVLLTGGRRINYYNNCGKATNAMIGGGSAAESANGMILDVWHNSIWGIEDAKTDPYTKNEYGYFYSDFNDALKKYADSDDYAERIKEILEYRDEAAKYMKKIRKGIPKQYEKLYEDVESFYDVFLQFTDMPLYMDGSYNSYLEKHNSLDDQSVTIYRKICTYYQ